MIKKISVIICLCLGLTFVACTKDTTNETTETNKPTTTDESEKETKTDDSEKETKTDETPVVKDIILTTYTANGDTYEVEKLSDITVKEDLPLQEKLTTLANELSVKAFQGLPITIVKIDTSNGSNKAIINLEEVGNNPSISWSKFYFQGSSGGITTSKTLIETFTQRSYTGDWVDSIEFQYKGVEIEYDHAADLKGTIKRN